MSQEPLAGTSILAPDGTSIHEPPAGREGSEGEGGGSGGSTNTTYSVAEDAIIQSFERTLRCLYNDPEMTFDWSQNLNMQSIGGPIQMGDCNLSDPLPSQEAVCACEQSIYHANLDGHECYNYNIQYWYHPDYLGSVEFVTDRDGEAYQFFLNTPWGENLEGHSSYSYKSFDSRFRFNGKELDPETGNYYYGARYYDPKVSVWLSVDPVLKHHESPYSFTSNNPIVFIDPDGRDTTFATNQDKLLVNQFLDPEHENYNEDFANKMQDLVDSEENYHFQSGEYDPGFRNSGWVGPDEESGDILVYFTMDGPYTKDGHMGRSQYSALFEETYHAWDYETGGLDFSNATAIDEAQAWKFAATAPGTKNVTFDYNGKAISTVMHQISRNSIHQVAWWLVNGLPTTSRGAGLTHEKGGGLYGPNGQNLPLGY